MCQPVGEKMSVDAERTGLTAGWPVCRWPSRVRSVASGLQVLATVGGGLGATYLAWASSTSMAQTIAITIIGLVGISGVDTRALAQAGRRAVVVLPTAGRTMDFSSAASAGFLASMPTWTQLSTGQS